MILLWISNNSISPSKKVSPVHHTNDRHHLHQKMPKNLQDPSDKFEKSDSKRSRGQVVMDPLHLWLVVIRIDLSTNYVNKMNKKMKRLWIWRRGWGKWRRRWLVYYLNNKTIAVDQDQCKLKWKVEWLPSCIEMN